MRDSNRSQSAVVVGIDGSQAAIHAAEWAVDEAISREVLLRLVEVIPERVEPAPLASVGNVRMEVEYGQTALSIACAAVEAAGKPVKVETAIIEGDPAAALIAESRDAEMICIGSVGIGRFAQALLGSTAAELAEGAHCPVAIIRSQQSQLKPHSALIVVAVDDSPDSDDVVEQAIEEARLRDAPVLALGVLRKDSGDMPCDELNRRVQGWGQRHPGVKIYAGNTRTDIADFVAIMDRTVQLAVIGSAYADQVARLLGPHRHPILGHAECSILVVRS
ncbi:MAG: universal stress protein [Mycobacterium sp.]|nr:universal stress protein [Mycobacterium sp.]MBV8291837.1 universal stress protein [Mycobacterium sp.]